MGLICKDMIKEKHNQISYTKLINPNLLPTFNTYPSMYSYSLCLWVEEGKSKGTYEIQSLFLEKGA